MNRILKRIISLTLAFAMVIGLLPAFEIKAQAAGVYAMTYDPRYAVNGFEAYWEEAYEYSEDHPDYEVTIMLKGDAVTTECLELQNYQKVTIDLNGYTLRRDLSERESDGQVFYTWDESVLTIMSSAKDAQGNQIKGTISGGSNDGYGGAFNLEEDARLILNGVNVSNNSSEDGGGAFYAQDNAQLELTNVVVCDNSTSGNGGAFYIEDNARLTMSGTTVSNNLCYDNGGAIYAINDAVVTITGGSLIGDLEMDKYNRKGNVSAARNFVTGAAIYMDDDTSLLINNAIIRGNDASYGNVGGIYWGANGVCQLVDVVIDENTAYKMCGGVYAPAGVYDTDIFLGGVVVIDNNRQRDENRAGTYGYASNLFLGDEDANINNYTENPLAEGSKIGITYGDMDSDTNDCITADGSKFEKADLSYFYYDLGDINGNIIRKVDHGKDWDDTENRWALYVTKADDSNNQIPAFTSAVVKEAYASGIQAEINREQRKLTLTVKNDSATKQYLRYAALSDFASFEYLLGDTQITDVGEVHNFIENPTRAYTVMAPNGTFEYWDITVLPQGGNWVGDTYVAKVVYTEGETTKEDSFVSFDTAWAAALSKPGSTFVLLADWLAGDNNSNSVIDAYETAGKFGGSLGEYWDGALYVHQKELTIDLNGHTIDRKGGGSVFYVVGNGKSGATEGKLIIKGSVGTGVITGGKCTNGNGGAFFVRDSNLYIYGGTITGNTASHGGAIFAELGSTVEIYGGAITGNTVGGEGGAIYASMGWVRIYDGAITNNKAYRGGAIVGSLQTKILIYGGEISGNEAAIGGAVYLALTSEATIEGGTISGNKASEKGGAFYLHDDGRGSVSKLNIKNGDIVENSAVDGGGIFVDLGADILTGVTISGGTISRNSASGSGGGIYMASGKIDMSDGTISGNTAYGRGGGVYMSSGTLNMQDGSINGNNVAGELFAMGGGVYVGGGSFNFSGGNISLNTITGHGGGVAVMNSASFTMSGGSIANNQGGQGGGVYWNSTGTAKLYGGSITGNNNGFWTARADSVKVYLGGDIKIKANGDTNLFLYNKSVDLRHDTEHPLKDGAEIGVYLNPGEYGDDNADRISAENGNFGEKSYPYFFSDLSGYRVANRENTSAASEDNHWHLHLVKIGTSADERPVINAVTVHENYRSKHLDCVIDKENREVTLYVRGDTGVKTALEKLSLTQLAAFTFATDDTKILGDVEKNLVENSTLNYVVRTPNGTYDYWTFRVRPDMPWGVVPPVATVTIGGNSTDYMLFADAWAAVVAANGPVTLKLLNNWLGGDVNSNGMIDSNETAGNFVGEGTSAGALAIYNANTDITIDLNGYKIDRKMSGSVAFGHVVRLSAGKLTIMDSSAKKTGTITGGKNSLNGGAFHITGENSVLTINSGNITGNTADKGGAIFAEGYADVVINGGSIASNTATDGGAIYLNGADLFVNGGDIGRNNAGNTAKNGGGIYMYSGSITMDGGSIAHNTAEVSGGGVGMEGGAFYFNNGYIQQNVANNGNGGGVYITGTARILTRGGNIEYNNANSGRGGGLFIGLQAENSPASSLLNTFVRGNSAKIGGGFAFYQTESCNVINTIRNVSFRSNLASVSGGAIDVDICEEQNLMIFGASITENRALKGAGIHLGNGVLGLVDSSVTRNIADDPSNGTPGIGAVYADNSAVINIGGTIVVNGNTIGSGGSSLSNVKSNLYLKTENNDIGLIGSINEGSYIGVSAGYDDNDDQISVKGFYLADGYYFHAEDSNYHIAMKDPGGEDPDRFTLHLTTESDSQPAILGAVAKIENLACKTGSFAEIDVQNRILTLTVNNTYKQIFSNMSFDDFVTITISEDFLFADDAALSTKQDFVSNPSKVYQLIEENDTGADSYDGWYSLWTIQVVPEDGKWSDQVGNVASVTTPVGTEYFYDMEMAYAYALTHAAYPGGATLTLNQDWLPVDAEDGFDYDEGTDGGRLELDNANINLTIDLNGFAIDRGLLGGEAISGGQVFLIEKGNLTIKDSSASQTGKITGAKNTGKGGAVHMTGGHLILESGTIIGNHGEKGAAVYVEYSAKFTMKGGILSANQASGNGGAIFLDDTAVFTMNGGEISGNYSNNGNGGGIYMEDSAVFTMNGGKISNNHASIGNGGGIYASQDGNGVKLTMNNGTISGNEAPNGGGIYWTSDDAKLYLNGGSIINNNATTGKGGGVYADDSGSDPYVGGTIRIVDNTEMDGVKSVQSNMYLEDDDSDLNHNTDNRLKEGAMIGIRFGYDDSSDYFSADGSRFDAANVAFFRSDNPDYIVQIKIEGSGSNANKLYLTRADGSDAVNSQAAIVGAAVKTQYASTVAPRFENNVAYIPVNPDKYLELTNGSLSLTDVVSSLSYSPYASMLDGDVIKEPTDLTKGVSVRVKAADNITIMTWLVKVVPGNESGTWNRYNVTLHNAQFSVKGAPTSYYPGETVSIKPNVILRSEFKDWNTVDMKNPITEEDGIFSFVMPANNVELTAEYYTVVQKISVVLNGKLEPTEPIFTNTICVTNQNTNDRRDVSIAWKIGDEVQTGRFLFNTTYTAEITVDYSAEADYRIGENVTGTVNSLPADVTVDEVRKIVTLRIDFTTPKAKILEKTTNYIADCQLVPSTEDEYTPEVAESILNDLNSNHSLLPVVTEDNEITTVKVEWTKVESFTKPENDSPYVTISGIVKSSANSDLDMTDYTVTAKAFGKQKVATPVITLKAIENAAGHKSAELAISCATPNAKIYYTLDGSDPKTSETRKLYEVSMGLATPAGSRTTITVRAIAEPAEQVEQADWVDSNVSAVTKTFNVPYELNVTGENMEGYTISGNDDLYKGESAVITITPKAGYWVSGIDAGSYGKVVNGSSIEITDIHSNVKIQVSCLPQISRITLDELSVMPGQAFPELNITGNGYTVTVTSWNTNDKTVAYGATYVPTVTVAVSGSSYPFAKMLNVTMGSNTVYSTNMHANVHTFKVPITAPKAMLTAVAPVSDVSIYQGSILNLPQSVNVTVEGNVITAAGVNWTCPNFNANIPGTYTYTGTLALPENVDANEKDVITVTVTVMALPKLPAPGASDHVEDITTVVNGQKVTVRATVVQLTSGTAGADIYYTLDGTDPAFDENGVSTAMKYNASTGIVLEESGSYTIKAVVHKQNYITSDVATFTYTVEVPGVYSVTAYNKVDNTSSLKQTLTAVEGETVQLTADALSGKTFLGWTVKMGTQTETKYSSNSISFTMPAGNVIAEANYLSTTGAVNLVVNAPAAYMALDAGADVSVTLPMDNDQNGLKDVVNWTDVPIIWTPAVNAAEFAAAYTGTITLKDDVTRNVIFGDKVTVNGIPGATAQKTGNTLTITFTMSAGKVNVNANLDLVPSEKLVIELGSSELQLPATLNVSTEAGSVAVPVVWSCDQFDSGVEGDYEFTASFDLNAAGVNLNGHTLSARITVSVVDNTVKLPVADVSSDVYTENQSVSLSCGTAGAVIYYTTDGSEPTAASTPYEGAIAVNGTAGATVTITIKAIAVNGEYTSAVATFQYTIKLPVIVTAHNVTVDGVAVGSYKPGAIVTVKANKVDGKYFVGWTASPELDGVNLNMETISFTMPDADVTLTANYKDNSVTAIDLRVTAPVAGSKLPETVSYDLRYADGSYIRNNTAVVTWTPQDAKGLRGTAYTMSVTIADDAGFAESLSIICNGSAIALPNGNVVVDNENNTVTFTRSFEKLSAAYSGHVKPTPITGIVEGTAFSEIDLPDSVTVTTVDGTSSSIGVVWTVPAGNIGGDETVTITGRLNSAELTAANITGGTNATVTVYVSSVAKQTVATPTASPVPGTEYLNSVTVTLSCATGGAVIYYTTDGTDPTTGSTRYTAPIKLTKDTVIQAFAVQSGMNDSAVATFQYTVTATYELNVVNGSGSGMYKAGETVSVTAKQDVDRYFTSWTANGITLTDEQRADTSLSFEMPANNVTLTANYAAKVNKVELSVPTLKAGEPLPGVNAISVVPGDVSITGIVWEEQSTAGRTHYTASITIKADHGFAEHGDVYVNGEIATSVMNNDGTVAVTYQTLMEESNESYVSHNFVSAPITGLASGTDLSTLTSDKLPVTAEITTYSGKTYTAAIDWDFEGCEYDQSQPDEQTFTLYGELILPAGVTGTNPKVSVTITVMAKPSFSLRVENGNGQTTDSYREGDTVTVKADNVDSKYFVGWSDGENTVSTSATYTFTMPAKDVSLRAVYSDKVSNVALTVDAPVAYMALDTTAEVSVGGAASANVPVIWTPAAGTAVYGTEYTATVTLKDNVANGIIFSDNVTVTGVSDATAVKSGDTLTIRFKMSAGKVNMNADYKIDNQKLVVAYGTAKDDVLAKLPKTLNVSTDAGMISVDATWSCADYDSTISANYVFTADLALNGKHIDQNGKNISASVTVVVSAQEVIVVAMPKADPATGSFTNLTTEIALSCETAGAVIYYTTDGTEPTASSTHYSGSIKLDTEGTHTIKAIAVKEGTSSAVATFQYTVKVPVPSYTVTVENGIGGGSYKAGETVTVKANKVDGKYFVGWTASEDLGVDLSAETFRFTMPAGNVTLTAKYAEKLLEIEITIPKLVVGAALPAITVNTGDVDATCAWNTNGNVAFNTSYTASIIIKKAVNLTDEPVIKVNGTAVNYQVVGDNMILTYELTTEKDRYTAGDVILDSITVVEDTNLVSTVKGKLPANVTITTASGASYNATVTWNYDGVDFEAENYTLTGVIALPEGIEGTAPAISVEITVTPKPTYTITVKNGNGEETASYEAGKIVTLTADELEGKAFVGWAVKMDGQAAERYSAKTISFTMPAKNVVAEALYVTTTEVVTLAVDAPVAYMALDTMALITTGDATQLYAPVTWTPAVNAAVYGTEYTAIVTLKDDLNKEVVFAENVTVNGVSGATAVKDGDTLTISFKMSAGKVNMNADLNYASTEEYVVELGGSAPQLPTTINVPTMAGNIAVSVQWTCDQFDSGVEGDYVYTASFDFDAVGVNPNGHALNANITVRVVDHSVKPPVANPVPGVYTENQIVTLRCATEGAVIYYTTDGSEPTTESARYEGAISVNGEAGASVTTTIKAIAVKDAEASAVATFPYTIELPKSSFTVTVVGGIGGGIYMVDDTVTLTADEPAGKVFAGWIVRIDGQLAERYSTKTITFTMPAKNVVAEAIYVTEADSVFLTVDAPMAYMPLDTMAEVTAGNATWANVPVIWTPAVSSAVYGTDYTATVILKDNENLVFADVVTVNGIPGATAEKNGDTLTISFTMSAAMVNMNADLNLVPTEKLVVELGSGAPLLPTTLDVPTVAGNIAVPVQWTCDQFNSGAVGDYVFTAIFNLDGAGVNPNGHTLNANITVSVVDTSVKLPDATPAPGVYTEDQNVTLNCATEGAVIYYTTDGTEPTVESAQYNGAISVNGVAGQTITTTIKAIAVKDEKASAVVTFQYTIKLPKPSFTVTVVNGIGGGIYKVDDPVTIQADQMAGYYFVGWSDGSNIVSTSSTYTFTMPANALTLTAMYEQQLSVIEITVPELVIGAWLPNVTATPNHVQLTSSWSETGVVAPNSTYTVSVIITKRFDMADELVVKVNGVSVNYATVGDRIMVVYEMNSGADSYVSNDFVSEPVTVAHGSDLAAMLDGKLPAGTTIYTASGASYSASVVWNFSGCSYDAENPAAQTVTLTGEIVLPDGIVGQNPQISVQVTVLAEPMFALIVNNGKETTTKEYVEGEIVTVVADHLDGWYFAGWSDGNNIVSTSSTYTFTMPASAVTLTATYEEQLGVIEITVPALVIGENLPEITFTPNNVQLTSSWSETGVVAPSSTYTLTITITKTVDMAEDLVIKVNGTSVTYEVVEQNLILTFDIKSADMPVEPDFPVVPDVPVVPPVIPVPPVPSEPVIPEAPCDGGATCLHHRYTDLDPKAWYHEAVDYVLSKGMMVGVADDKFDPNGATSRSMIVTILWRLEGEPVVGGADVTFNDVAEGKWYTAAVKWAAATGIVSGYDGTFNPNGNITREQVASILYRYAQYKGIDVSVGKDTNIHTYKDAGSVSGWAEEAMQWAVGCGLMVGDGVSLTPASNATRCQSAALLMRFLENVVKKN